MGDWFPPGTLVRLCKLSRNRVISYPKNLVEYDTVVEYASGESVAFSSCGEKQRIYDAHGKLIAEITEKEYRDFLDPLLPEEKLGIGAIKICSVM